MKTNNHKKVLNWINAQRKNLGLKPIISMPRGIQEDVYSCPIAAAFQDKSFNNVEVSNEVRIERDIPIPKAVHDFVSKLGQDLLDDYGFTELLHKTITDTTILEMPEYVSDFVEKFDSGSYPELVEE